MRAGHNVTTDGLSRAGSTELAGRIWPAGRTLPTPDVEQHRLTQTRRLLTAADTSDSGIKLTPELAWHIGTEHHSFDTFSNKTPHHHHRITTKELARARRRRECTLHLGKQAFILCSTTATCHQNIRYHLSERSPVYNDQ